MICNGRPRNPKSTPDSIELSNSYGPVTGALAFQKVYIYLEVCVNPTGGDINWKTVPGFPNYAVSDQGDVVNTRYQRYLELIEDPRGYYRVWLYNKGEKKHFYVHQLVAMCFIHDGIRRNSIRHKNKNLSDNRPENLEIIRKPNDRDRPTSPMQYRKDVITTERVVILETGERFKTPYAAAKKYDLDPNHVYRVLNGKAYSHAGMRFRYVDVQVVL